MKRDLGTLAVSLLLAFLVWVFHNLSLNYSASLQYRVAVTSQVEGHENHAVSREALVIRGDATGFLVLSARSHRKNPQTIEVKVDPKFLHSAGGEGDLFTLATSDIREQLAGELSGWLNIDFIETDSLSFNFASQSYVKVPVNPQISLSFAPQHMQVGEMEIRPDSVLVYGDVQLLAGVTEVRTERISLGGLRKPAQGYASLESLKGLRIDCSEVLYSVDVQRYVEQVRTVQVKAVNLPDDKRLMFLPSSVELTWRAPFSSKAAKGQDDMSLTVDYREFSASRNSKTIPVLETDREIFSYSLSPRMVECIIVEE